MSEYEEEIPDEDKVKIASDFIVHAPPGEFNEVFNDVRVLLGNDQLLKDGASSAFADYNEEQYTPATLEGSDQQVLITSHGNLGPNKYLDPRTGQSFSFDHLRKATTDLEPVDVDDCDGFRAAFEKALTDYTKDHFMKGACTVYGNGDEVICCIEHHKFQPNNFWNGRWRSRWTFNKSTGELEGLLRVQVHYYEDGNVQMQSNKSVKDKLSVSDPAATARAAVKKIDAAESVYQRAISANYQVMSDTTFKALRRALPITRQKLDWNKVLNYKIGKEIANK